MAEKIKTFTDLDAWKEGHRLVLIVYKITQQFPKEEVFGLISQMRRCTVSITSNIAEGFSRNTFKEKIQFFSIAQGSNTELQNQLLISKDVKYISEIIYSQTNEQSIKVHKIVNGLIKKCRFNMHNT